MLSAEFYREPDVLSHELPINLVTNFGSDLDPHISSVAALVQIPRISGLTGVSADIMKELINEHIDERDLGLLEEGLLMS